jgi:O-antigen/teichoic acid export membrane protein
VGERDFDSVNFWRHRFESWRADNILRRVVRNSGYLFSSTTISAVLSFAQGIFAVRLLGINGYGLAVGTIMLFASNVNRLLSFRMSEVMVKYLAEALTQKKYERAAAIVKSIGLVEGFTSVAAYLILLVLTPWAARTFAKDPTTAPLFAFYGLSLLSNLIYETSTGVLQATDRFDRVAVINLIQSIITAIMIFLDFILKRGMMDVLTAYLVGKTFTGIAVIYFAVLELNKVLGKDWYRASLRQLTDWRSIGSFAINTNLNGTITLFVRDNAPLYLAALGTVTEVGYFKLALSLVNVVSLPIEPFIWPTYAELTRSIALRQWKETKRLLRRVSAIAGGWTLAAGGGLVALGWWLLPLVYGADARPAYFSLAILLIGYGMANVFHWNRPLLLAFGMPGFPVMAMTVVGVVEIALIFLLVPHYGYLAESAIVSGFFVVAIGWIVWRGLSVLHQKEISAE